MKKTGLKGLRELGLSVLFLVTTLFGVEEMSKLLKNESQMNPVTVSQAIDKIKVKPVAKETEPVIIEIPKKELMPIVDLNVRSKAGGFNVRVINMVNKHEKLVVSKKTEIGRTTWYYSERYKGWLSGAFLVDYKKMEHPETILAHKIIKRKNYKPFHIYYGNKAVSFKNGGKAKGQTIINSTKNASTWGGAPIFNGNDRMNTHFIGREGRMNQLSGIQNHNVFVVTDGQGNAFKYVKTAKYVVNEYGIRPDTDENMFDRIMNKDGGERIVLQSTKKGSLKWIIEAEFVEKIN